MSAPSVICLTINGAAREVPAGLTVAGLLQHLDLAGKRTAVELNNSIVARSAHPTVSLAAGDRLEIIHAIGGG